MWTNAIDKKGEKDRQTSQPTDIMINGNSYAHETNKKMSTQKNSRFG